MSNTLGIAAIAILLIIAIGYTLWQHRPKPAPKPPTLAQELEASALDALRLRIAYEGEAEYAKAMAEYQAKRYARLQGELEALAPESPPPKPVTVAPLPEGFFGNKVVDVMNRVEAVDGAAIALKASLRDFQKGDRT